MSGKSKGSAFERKIAKEIVKAYAKFGITQKDCWRSTLSGGHARAAGDLEISERLAKIFPFCLEMKHRKKIRFENFLLAKKSKEDSWITQTIEGSMKTDGMYPVLVMRANNCPVYALLGQKAIGTVFEDTTGLESHEYVWRMMPWNRFLKLAIAKIRRFPRLKGKKHGKTSKNKR